MDDYKRGLYMEARRLIEDCVTIDVCDALYICLDDWGHGTIAHIFPEFCQLFDGYRYHRNNTKCTALSVEYWWEKGWKEPRLRAIDYLLRD